MRGWRKTKLPALLARGIIPPGTRYGRIPPFADPWGHTCIFAISLARGATDRRTQPGVAAGKAAHNWGLRPGAPSTASNGDTPKAARYTPSPFKQPRLPSLTFALP